MSKDKPLNIAYDAKRAFFNKSGLGNYSRDLIKVLAAYEPQNHYYLFKHKDKKGIEFDLASNTEIVLPQSKFYTKYGSLWRSYGISKELKYYPIDIYHGLSQELPLGIEKSNVKTVVTIHDCIFLRYPELFDISFRIIFKKKYAHACKVADRIIAISEQTKQDIMHYFNVPEDKIELVYQGCSPIFYNTEAEEKKNFVREKYGLPDTYILSVGSIEERKNLMGIFEALVEGNIDIPVVAIGKSTAYADKVKAYVKKHKLEDKALFIHNADFEDFPSVYQMATVFVYPSMFEGFGIPILEALNSNTPVITTVGSCFPEVGGTAARYVEFGNTLQMIEELKEVLANETLRKNMVEKGAKQALLFREEKIAKDLMEVYRKVMN